MVGTKEDLLSGPITELPFKIGMLPPWRAFFLHLDYGAVFSITLPESLLSLRPL
jgi:hypothetical protein